MTGFELSRLNNEARSYFSRWVPHWKVVGMAMYGRRLTHSTTASGITTVLYHNPVTGRVECWGLNSSSGMTGRKSC